MQITDDAPDCYPPDPPYKDSEYGRMMSVPDDIRPVMAKHRVEVCLTIIPCFYKLLNVSII